MLFENIEHVVVNIRFADNHTKHPILERSTNIYICGIIRRKMLWVILVFILVWNWWIYDVLLTIFPPYDQQHYCQYIVTNVTTNLNINWPFFWFSLVQIFTKTYFKVQYQSQRFFPITPFFNVGFQQIWQITLCTEWCSNRNFYWINLDTS